MGRTEIQDRIISAQKTIRIKVSTEAELYDPLDPDGMTLSSRVRDYLTAKTDLDLYMGKDTAMQFEPQHVQIVSKCEIDTERLRNAICGYYDDEISKCVTSLSDLRKQEYGLLFFSIILYAGSIISAGVGGGTLTAILAAVGGFTSFQFCDYWLFRSRNCLLKKRAYQFLKNIRITQ